MTEEYVEVLINELYIVNSYTELCTPIFYVRVVNTAVYFSTLTVPLRIKPNSLQRIKYKKSGKIIPQRLVRNRNSAISKTNKCN